MMTGIGLVNTIVLLTGSLGLYAVGALLWRLNAAGGASGAIYGLMAICLVWAPKNCIDVLMVWGIGMWFRIWPQ